jgi:hypothetical protein
VGNSVKMLISSRRLSVILLGAAAIAAAAPARAQEGNSVGPPVLRDFQLQGERRTPPAQPQPVQPQPVQSQPVQAQPSQTQPAQPRVARPAATPPGAARPAPTRAAPTRTEAAPSPQPAPAQPMATSPSIPVEAAPGAPLQSEPQSVPQPGAGTQPAPRESDTGTPFWMLLLPVVALALGGALFLRRRRRPAEVAEPVAAAPAAAALPPRPRPAPVPRPWLELELRAERAASTESEARVDIEMVIHNSGKSPARNIRINARMFNAGREQDQEIGAFFKNRGEGRRTHEIAELPADERGLIQGSVTMPREEMRALQVNNQALFIPVIAVNLVYDWGEGRTGQTSKSYLIGRDLGAANERMGAFRLDLGPRVYRTVGQRAHSLERRV